LGRKPESGNIHRFKTWIPAFAGMTASYTPILFDDRTSYDRRNKGGDFLAKHKKIERMREIERRRHRREKRKKLAAKTLKEAAAAPAAV
jgi:hypothetical protein